MALNRVTQKNLHNNLVPTRNKFFEKFLKMLDRKKNQLTLFQHLHLLGNSNC